MKNITITVLLIFLLAPSAQAAKSPDIKFLSTVELPHLGMKLKIMPKSKTMPLPPPTVYTYESNTGVKTERYSARDLWHRTQHKGIWHDMFGNAVIIGEITQLLDDDLRSKAITKEEFSLNKGAVIVDGKCNSEMLLKWIGDFTMSSNVVAKIVKKSPRRLKGLVTYTLMDNAAQQKGYSFRFNTSAAGQSRATKSTFFILIEISKDANLERSLRSIESSFLPSITCMSRTAKKPVTSSREFQQKGLSKGNNKSAQFLESKKNVVESITNMKDWWFVETDNYILLSNLKTKYRMMVKDLQANIEYLRSAYERFIPPLDKIEDVSTIRIFASSSEYLSYVGAAHQWTGGLWMPSKRELVIRPLDWGGSKDQKRRVYATTYHEAFHQYIFYALDKTRTSMWFNEGHADLFASSAVKNRKLVIAENERSLVELSRIIRNGGPYIDKIIIMSHEDFYKGSDEDRKANYTLSWALIYYLRKYVTTQKNSPYSDILEKYITELKASRDHKLATTEAFKGIDMVTFTKDFEAFWKSKNSRGVAKRNMLFKNYKAQARKKF